MRHDARLMRGGIRATLSARWAVAAIALLCLVAAGPANANPIVRFTTNLGTFDVELFQSQVPTTVGNFLSYVNAGSYTNSIIHRSTTYTTGIQIVQGGGFFLNETTTPPSLDTIATGAPIALDAILPNLQGTIAMARTNDPDSATSGWYFNVTDNPQLDATPGAPGTGYTVFGRIVPGDLGVLDAIAGVQVFNASAELGPAFSELPLFGPELATNNLVMVNSIAAVPEPTTIALALTGLLGLAVLRRRK
jgi:peptidyl-prolyl cis-trans isomerase A (cyclophilin A)